MKISLDIDKPGRNQTKDGEWHEGVIPLDVEAYNPIEIINEIVQQVTEDAENFVIQTIRPYCEEIARCEISKKDLQDAMRLWVMFKNGDDPITEVKKRIKYEDDTNSMNYNHEPRVVDYQDYFHGMRRAVEIIDEEMAKRGMI